MKRKKRRWKSYLFLMAAGAVLAIYYADPITDFLERSRVVTFGPPGKGKRGGPTTREVVLFFVGGKDDKLVRLSREIEKADSLPDQMRRTLEALIAGPGQEGVGRSVPAGTRVRSIIPGPDGTVYVDFNRALREEHPGGAWNELLTAQAIANTLLVNFRESFERVVILIDGQEAETIAGQYSIAGPLRLREDIVLEEEPVPETVEAAAPAAPAPAPAAPPAPPPPPPAAGLPRAGAPTIGVPSVGAVGVPSGGAAIPPAGTPSVGEGKP